MSALAEKRILIVEDEFLISAMLCDMLRDSGATVIGPAASVSAALRMIDNHWLDAAVLDMNLNGQWIDPVAEALHEQGTPFVFTTGYGTNGRSQKFGARTVEKPFLWEDVEMQLTLALLEHSNGQPMSG
jgi:DNA-binding response OmpR family regulator